MAFVTIRERGLAVTVSSTGGSIVDGHFEGLPFLRPFSGVTGRDYAIADAACFPLVPFGNRLGGNAFSFAGADYRMAPNTGADPLYLHGDGWLQDWQIAGHEPDRARLTYRHAPSPASPYAYSAHQQFLVRDGFLHIEIGVRNEALQPLPYGLGLHPFFPRTPQTRLQASAAGFWDEGEGHLPRRQAALPDDLDFRKARILPQRWVNNAFENWAGTARILWPETGLAADIAVDPVFRHYMLYMPADDGSFFCFEPMSHLPNGHHLPGLGGLVPLPAGGEITATMTIRPWRPID